MNEDKQRTPPPVLHGEPIPITDETDAVQQTQREEDEARTPREVSRSEIGAGE